MVALFKHPVFWGTSTTDIDTALFLCSTTFLLTTYPYVHVCHVLYQAVKYAFADRTNIWVSSESVFKKHNDLFYAPYRTHTCRGALQFPQINAPASQFDLLVTCWPIIFVFIFITLS